MVTYRNELSVTPGGRAVVINLSQRDTNVTLIFDLYSVTGDLNIQSNSSVVLSGHHFKDNSSFSINGTISGNTATFVGNSDLTSVPGKAIAEVTITKSDKRLSTSNFIFDIEPAA